jgi:endonuclease YncB( thermonuclease family)
VPRGLPTLGSLALLAILIVALLTGGSDENSGEALPDSATVAVTDVVDGDTIEVAYEGETEDVRYIGVDTLS